MQFSNSCSKFILNTNIQSQLFVDRSLMFLAVISILLFSLNILPFILTCLWQREKYILCFSNLFSHDPWSYYFKVMQWSRGIMAQLIPCFCCLHTVSVWLFVSCQTWVILMQNFFSSINRYVLKAIFKYNLTFFFCFALVCTAIVLEKLCQSLNQFSAKMFFF